MDSQNWFTLLNILVTVIVGVILRNQIKSQKSIIDSYKDFVSVIDPKIVLGLKEEEINQIKLNTSNDIQVLQKQISELSFYVNHIISHGEESSKEIGITFDRDSFIRDVLPSCRNLLNFHKVE